MPEQPSSSAARDGRVARWAGQRCRRRAEIVDAAVDAIGAYGPGVSIDQIAAQAGIARPRLYRHFDDVEDLRRAVARRAGRELFGAVTPVLSNPVGTPWSLIECSVEMFVTWLDGNADLYRYVKRSTGSSKSEADDVVTDIRGKLARWIGRILADYFAVFELDTRTADSIAFGLVGLVESATNRWMSEPAELTRDEFVATVARCVWGVIEHTLQGGGVRLAPHESLPPLPLNEPDGVNGM
ncbi:TetR/AcrR family transcriptional regulator [Haloechinothrix sp. YIM 98757]|uniref:TetR/AcrR family transcriptional regulator n=1 Tax=Haloechinothrix aidingensis TaxID=2752311 RepID=A0A838A6P3_9PSEU|nr:TetR/AcrR family transcriptional regulator [Haloechinothrix aidingensis]